MERWRKVWDWLAIFESPNFHLIHLSLQCLLQHSLHNFISSLCPVIFWCCFDLFPLRYEQVVWSVYCWLIQTFKKNLYFLEINLEFPLIEWVGTYKISLECRIYERKKLICVFITFSLILLAELCPLQRKEKNKKQKKLVVLTPGSSEYDLI